MFLLSKPGNSSKIFQSWGTGGCKYILIIIKLYAMKNWIKMVCLFAGLMLMANAAEAQYTTGVYVNNQELNVQTINQLQQ